MNAIDVRPVADQTAEIIRMAGQNLLLMQQGVTRWWSMLLGAADDGGAPRAAHAQARQMQESVGDGLRVMERSWNAGFGMLEKMLDAGKSMAEFQTRTQGLIDASLATVRAQAESLMDMNAQAMRLWMGLVRHSEQVAAPAAESAGDEPSAKQSNAAGRRQHNQGGRAKRSRRK